MLTCFAYYIKSAECKSPRSLSSLSVEESQLLHKRRASTSRSLDVFPTNVRYHLWSILNFGFLGGVKQVLAWQYCRSKKLP